MAYDEALAERIRSAVGRRAGATEKKMFGGIAFLLDGKTFCGVVGDDLMVRVGPELHEQALGAPHARPMMDYAAEGRSGHAGRRAKNARLSFCLFVRNRGAALS